MTIKKKTIVNKHVMLSRLKSKWTAIVWVMAIVVAVFAYVHGGQFGGMTGTVITRLDRLAPLEAGVVESLKVQVGDVVKKGDVLAQMDTSLLMEEKKYLEAAAEIRCAEIKEAQIQNLRRFDSALVRLKSELRDMRMKQFAEQGEVDALQPEYERLSKLLASGMVDEQVVMPLRLKLGTLNASLAATPAAMKEIEVQIAEAARQREEIVEHDGLNEELILAELKIEKEMLDLRIEAGTLRAREDGIVSRIYEYPGSNIEAGASVVATVVTEEEQHVVGFLSEFNARDVLPGMEAILTPISGSITEAEVIALTPEIMTLPKSSSPSEAALRGRRVILKVSKDSKLLPGEEVQIHFSRPWSPRMFWHVLNPKNKVSE